MNKICEIIQADVFTDIHRILVWGRTISLFLLFWNTWIIGKTAQLIAGKRAKFHYIVLLLILLLPMHFFSFRPDSLKVSFVLLLITPNYTIVP